MQPVIANHLLLQKLHRAHHKAARAFPIDNKSSFHTGFGDVGLVLQEELGSARYDWCTPRNAWSFAWTGGEAVHFSLLALNGKIDEDSPVVVTNPADGMGFTHVVGENLFDFLCFGSRRGYFALGYLQYDLELTLQAYTDESWEPTLDSQDCVGFGVNQHQRLLLDFLTKEFGLNPWSSKERFEELQARYEHLIEWPE